MTTEKTRKILLLTILVVLLTGVGIWFAVHQGSSAGGIGHVVLISIDTCRADYLSCYGYARPTTPNIDALAEEGYLFSRAMTPIPVTLPAHTSMLTGTIPPHHGKHENKDEYFDPSHVTLAALFKKKGYSTGAFIGSQVLNHQLGLNRGFDIYEDGFEESELQADEVNRAAFAWLEEQKDKPVFLFLHYYDPHDDYVPPEPFATTFKEIPYAGEIAYTDHCIGEVIAKLKSLDMYESSLIIVTADHGEMLGEHGELTHMYFIYQSSMHVPLIYKLPGSSGPHKIDDPTSIIDIVPTVCDLMDIEPPAGIQGKNLAGYFSGEPPQMKDRYLYCESLYPTKYEANSLLGLIGRQWKYIQTTRPELYDLQKDPGEQTNLVEKESQRARILKDRLAQVLEQTVRQGKGQEDTPLDEEILGHLHSLGYVASSSVTEDFSFDQSKDDPKDLIGYHNDSREVSHLVQQSKFVEARALIERLSQQRPTFGLYELGTHVALKQKDYKAAIRYGEKALELEKSTGSKFYVSFHLNLASAYGQTQQHEAAAEQLELILECTQHDPVTFQARRTQVNNQLAVLRFKQEKYDLAIFHFNESLKLDGNQPEVLHDLARLRLSCPDQTIRDAHKAVERAKQACKLTQSKNAKYLNTLAVAYFTTNNYKDAAEACEKALALVQAEGDQARAAKLQQQLELIKRASAGR
jgi:arylsulfatase A-like enzyme